MMPTVYKLTDQNMRTHGGFQWELGKEVRTSGEGDLCGPGWLHCYDDPVVAMMLNPIHAGFKDPRMFRAETGGNSKHDHGLKSGYTRMALIEEIPVPEVTTTQRIAFGILCSLEQYRNPGYVAWAEKWLSGEDRSTEAAAEAAETAAWAAVWAAETAAWAAVWAAEAAAETAAWAAAWAAEAAWAAGAAEAAAWAAAANRISLNLPALARKAMAVT